MCFYLVFINKQKTSSVINSLNLHILLQNIENFMKDVYKDRYGKDIQEDSVNKLYSIAVSIFAIGGMLGGFSGGMIANRFGRYSRRCCILYFQNFNFYANT